MSFVSGIPVLEPTTNSPNDSNLHLNTAGASATHVTNDSSGQNLTSSEPMNSRFAEVAAIARSTRQSSLTDEASSRTVLHEFQSLLEAAQRIADGAESSSIRDSQPDEQIDPIIRRTAAVPRQAHAQLHEGRFRVPLTRQYSGRPHVPGEDSGSEHEDYAEEGEEEEPDSEDLFSQLGYTRPSRTDLDSLFEDQSSSDSVSENSRRIQHARAQMEAYRARDTAVSIAEQMERDRESLRQAVAMTRELRRHQQNRTLYHDETVASGPLFTSSENRPQNTDHSSNSTRWSQSHTTMTPRSDSRSNSIRRWRPAERLQDYASSHTRRSSRDDHATSNSQSAVQATTAGIPLTWRNQGEGNTFAIQSGGRRTHERDRTSASIAPVADSAAWSTHRERTIDPWSDSWSSEFGSRLSRLEQNDHDEIVSRVERALQEYRLSRRNLRASQEDSTAYPLSSRSTLGELSSARASRRQTSTSFSPESPGSFNWDDRWRRDDATRRRSAEQTREHRRRYLHRLQTTLEGLQDSERRAREITKIATKEINASMKAAKASLRYLATLREPETDAAKAWTTAAELGLHNKSLHETPNERLPASIQDLPAPSVCSWLEPGMTWLGTQSADEEDVTPKRSMEARLQDLETRSTNLREVLNYPQPRSIHDSMERTHTHYHSSHLETRNARLHGLALRDANTKVEPARAKDHWKVKAVLHSVDWEDMTLTGTMTASQIRGLAEPESTNLDSNLDDGASMDSFFTGEIIDFLHFGLDTLSSAEREASRHAPSYRDKRQQNDWKVGGPEADLIHWAGLGPFKEEINRILEKRQDSYDRMVQKLNISLQDPAIARSSASDHEETDRESQLSDPLNYTESELKDLQLDTMHKVLTDKNWLNEHINNEGWVLMRWKERCFVSPGTDPNPEPTRPWIPTRAPAASARSSSSLSGMIMDRGPFSAQDTQRIYSTNDAEREELSGSRRVDNTNTARSAQPTWGLTISGFYYVALHRQTGRVEALYYDCTSAPYQRLSMEPSVHSGGNRGFQRTPTAFEGPGGLRSSFSVVEFR